MLGWAPDQAHRRRLNLVTEQTRIVNQIKAILTRFGIRAFRSTRREVEEKLERVRTAEGTPLPENTRADQERLRKLAATPAGEKGPHVMVRLIARL